MAERTANYHASFVLHRLKPAYRLLDCGCGPGSISCGLAEILSAGHVSAVDQEVSQIELAQERVSRLGLTNIDFSVSSIFDLPYGDETFDVVFSHAVFEHISSPHQALAEFIRVLRPGGLVAIRSPDWGGFLVGPQSTELDNAIQSYAQLQTSNGGDTRVGRKLPALLRGCGLVDIEFSASYDCSVPPPVVAEYFALKLNDTDAEAMHRWASDIDAFFATAWCAAIGRKRG